MQEAATAFNLSVLALRVVLGVVFLAHGINHVFGGGKITGTGRWFESLGMKPGVIHAWLASLTEIGSGLLLMSASSRPLLEPEWSAPWSSLGSPTTFGTVSSSSDPAKAMSM